MTRKWARRVRRTPGLDAVGFLPKRRDALSKSRKLQTRGPHGRRDLWKAWRRLCISWMFAAGTQVREQEVGLTSAWPPPPGSRQAFPAVLCPCAALIYFQICLVCIRDSFSWQIATFSESKNAVSLQPGSA